MSAICHVLAWCPERINKTILAKHPVDVNKPSSLLRCLWRHADLCQASTILNNEDITLLTTRYLRPECPFLSKVPPERSDATTSLITSRLYSGQSRKALKLNLHLRVQDTEAEIERLAREHSENNPLGKDGRIYDKMNLMHGIIVLVWSSFAPSKVMSPNTSGDSLLVLIWLPEEEEGHELKRGEPTVVNQKPKTNLIF